jgi:hypothetical protein
MVLNTASGTHLSSGGVTSSEVLVANIGAGSWLTKCFIQGYLLIEQLYVTFATGDYPVYNFAAGVQYGPTGYTVVDITDGNIETATWISWGEMLPTTTLIQDLPGASPQSAMQANGNPLMLVSRKIRYFPVGSDVYVVIGSYVAGGGVQTYKASYTWYLEWAS